MPPKAAKKKQAQIIAEAIEEWKTKEDLWLRDEVTRRVLLDAAKQQLAKMSRKKAELVERIESTVHRRQLSSRESDSRKRVFRDSISELDRSARRSAETQLRQADAKRSMSRENAQNELAVHQLASRIAMTENDAFCRSAEKEIADAQQLRDFLVTLRRRDMEARALSREVSVMRKHPRRPLGLLGLTDSNQAPYSRKQRHVLVFGPIDATRRMEEALLSSIGSDSDSYFHIDIYDTSSSNPVNSEQKGLDWPLDATVSHHALGNLDVTEASHVVADALWGVAAAAFDQQETLIIILSQIVPGSNAGIINLSPSAQLTLTVSELIELTLRCEDNPKSNKISVVIDALGSGERPSEAERRSLWVSGFVAFLTRHTVRVFRYRPVLALLSAKRDHHPLTCRGWSGAGFESCVAAFRLATSSNHSFAALALCASDFLDQGRLSSFEVFRDRSGDASSLPYWAQHWPTLSDEEIVDHDTAEERPPIRDWVTDKSMLHRTACFKLTGLVHSSNVDFAEELVSKFILDSCRSELFRTIFDSVDTIALPATLVESVRIASELHFLCSSQLSPHTFCSVLMDLMQRQQPRSSPNRVSVNVEHSSALPQPSRFSFVIRVRGANEDEIQSLVASSIPSSVASPVKVVEVQGISSVASAHAMAYRTRATFCAPLSEKIHFMPLSMDDSSVSLVHASASPMTCAMRVVFYMENGNDLASWLLLQAEQIESARRFLPSALRRCTEFAFSFNDRSQAGQSSLILPPDLESSNLDSHIKSSTNFPCFLVHAAGSFPRPVVIPTRASTTAPGGQHVVDSERLRVVLLRFFEQMYSLDDELAFPPDAIVL